jgi:hypothetical protein
MAGAVAGIELPPGNPGSIRDTAQKLRKVGSGFEQTGHTARAAASSVHWSGAAAEAFGARTGDYEDAARKADTASSQAAGVLTTFADRLQQGIDKVKKLQDQALDAQTRMENAQLEASMAGQRENAARASASGLSGLLDPISAQASMQEADDAAADRIHYEGIANAASDELADLRRQAEAERQAVKDAATAAAGQMNGAQDGMPVVYHGGMYGTAGAMEDRVLAHVRSGDYSVLDGLDINTLDEGTQQAVGAELAKDAQVAAVGKGDHSISEIGRYVQMFNLDGEFDAGFYNQMGGHGASDFVHNLIFFSGTDDGLHGDELVALMAPFAGALGGATQSGLLNRGFASKFFGDENKPGDRDQIQLPAFLMAVPASMYSAKFAEKAGREVLIDPTDPFLDEQNAAHYELSDHQDFMQWLAGNPEGAGLLLAGHHGPDNHFNNASTLLLAGWRYTDNGDALGALIQAGAVDLHATNPAVANEAAHQIIITAPHFDNGYPDGARQPLVSILHDHVTDFEHAATQAGTPRPLGDHPEITLNYDQSHDYLKMLFADGSTSHETASILGDQVGSQMHQAIVTGDPSHAVRAGSLSELTLSSSGDAGLDAAHAQDTANALKSAAAGKLLSLTPPGKVPGVSEVANVAFGHIFPTDAVEHGLTQNHIDTMNKLHSFTELSVKLGVAHGTLPEQASHIVAGNGNVLTDFTGTPSSTDPVIHNVGPHSQWSHIDANHDGTITEDELFNAATNPGDQARDGFLNTWKGHN